MSDDVVDEPIAPAPAAPPPPAAPIPLKNSAGKVVTFDSLEHAQNAINAGYTTLSPDELLTRQVKHEEKAKGVVGSIEEGAKSFGNQFLLGVPDYIAEKTSTPEENAHREAVDRYHSLARTVGGIGGFGASALLGGGALEGIGDIGAHLVAPAAELADATLATRVAAKAASSAAQGLALSTPQAVTQAAFGDPKKAAETLFWGLGAGAVLGAGGGLLSEGVGAAKNAATALFNNPEVSDRLAQASENMTYKVLGANRSITDKMSPEWRTQVADFAHDQGLIQSGMSKADVQEAVAAAHSKFGKNVGDAIEALDNAAGIHSDYSMKLSPESLDMPEAQNAFKIRKGLGVDVDSGLNETESAVSPFKIGKDIRIKSDMSEGTTVGDGPITNDRRAPELRSNVEQKAIPKSGPAFEIQNSMADAYLKPGEISAKLRAQLDSPEMQMPMNRDQANALQLVAESADKIPTTNINGQDVVSFKDSQDFLRSLRQKWVGSINKSLNDGGVRGMETVTALDQAKANAYQYVRDAIHDAADKVAATAENPQLSADLVQGKLDYAKISQIEKAVRLAQSQAAGNRAVSLTDFIHMGNGPVGAGAQAVGAGLGALFGGPAGAVAGGMVAKPVGMALDYLTKQWMQNRGLVLGATMLRRAAKEGPELFSAALASDSAARLTATMGTVRDAVSDLAMNGATRGSRNTDHMGHMLGSTTGLTADQAYAKLGARLTALAANPGAMASAVSATSAPLVTTAPEVAAQYQAKQAQAISYLFDALPKPPAPPAPFAPQNWSPDPAAKLAFHDKAEVVNNPMAALRHVQQGTLSDDHIHALQTVYPTIYSMMQNEVLRWAATHPDVKLPPAERRSVGKFLGQPLDPTEQLTGIRALQSTYAPPPPAAQTGAKPGAKQPGAKLKDLPSHATGFSGTQGASELHS